MPIGSLVTTFEAKISPDSPIAYYFVNEGEFTNGVYEFTLKDQYSGQIYLSRSLNSSIASLREVFYAIF